MSYVRDHVLFQYYVAGTVELECVSISVAGTLKAEFLCRFLSHDIAVSKPGWQNDFDLFFKVGLVM